MSDPRLGALSLERLTSYLRDKGWHRIEHPNNRILVYELPDQGSVVLPASEDLEDFEERMRDTVEIISRVEELSFDTVLWNLLTRGVDIFRARIMDTPTAKTGISLEEAGKVIPLLRQLIGYGACSQLSPRPYFFKATNVSRDFTAQCRFGHTFQGSFGFTIECPLKLPPSDVLPAFSGLVNDVPFERKVTERLARGFQSTIEAVQNGTAEPLVTNYAHGFNANMCEALAQIVESLNGKPVEHSMAWASEVPIPTTLAQSSFLIESRAFVFLKEAAEQLHKIDPPLETTIEGKVVILRSDEPPQQDQFGHIVTMNWQPEKLPIYIRVALSTEEYLAACDAHKEGRRIRITGVPAKQGKFWVLENPHGFAILPH